ncbi:hypothetical protein M408DRAFT_325904 [Serendipita vermifera MAFF 305830]|uniref:3-ketoacyl-CoA thiolase n=1 Tax=Serendipita vermifera MAFF 305830 TaxID=933852 RepID=A0A0C2Y0A0_SERVB|nr:hypothetical protein M408DRAFT_325904 [Serendipita vermifera MAFF 305830]
MTTLTLKEKFKRVAEEWSSAATGSRLHAKSPEDVVITMAIRSPMCKAKKGGYKDMRSDELLTSMFKATLGQIQIDPALIEDICVGTVLPTRAPYEARAAALAAGIPETTPVQTINRLCSSGLMAVTTISNQIRAGQIEIGLAVGVESMTRNPDMGTGYSEEIMAHPVAKDCAQPMGWTSENVAEDFNISREDMDKLAALSFQRASRAQKDGTFATEIVPLEALRVDPATGKRTTVVISEDDGIRHGTTAEALGKIKSAFPQWGAGKTTGGNASQVTDGAAAVLLMTRRKAEELGLKILAKHVTTAVAGLAPRIMGIGPSIAIPMVFKKAGITKDDVDLFEINEAFASMYVYCVNKLDLDIEKVNVNGGAIALGHPLGTTGARQIATGLNALERRGGKVLVTSMCIGLGMGAAAVFVRD